MPARVPFRRGLPGLALALLLASLPGSLSAADPDHPPRKPEQEATEVFNHGVRAANAGAYEAALADFARARKLSRDPVLRKRAEENTAVTRAHLAMRRAAAHLRASRPAEAKRELARVKGLRLPEATRRSVTRLDADIAAGLALERAMALVGKGRDEEARATLEPLLGTDVSPPMRAYLEKTIRALDRTTSRPASSPKR